LGFCLLFSLTSTAEPVQAQTEWRVADWFDQFSTPGAQHFFEIRNVQPGGFIYVRAEQFSGTLAALELRRNITDSPLLTGEIIADDFGGSVGTLVYEARVGGDYVLMVQSDLDETSSYTLQVGINAPQVLEGSAEVNDPEMLWFLDEVIPEGVMDTLVCEPQVQVVKTGFATTQTTIELFVLPGLPANCTLYIYADALESGMDPQINLYDPRNDLVASDDDSGIGLDATLAYTLQDPGDYTIDVLACCGTLATGDFQLTVGLEVPEVLIGSAQDTGAILIDPNFSVVPDEEPPTTLDTAKGYLEKNSEHYYQLEVDGVDPNGPLDVLYLKTRIIEGNATPLVRLYRITPSGEYELMTQSQPVEGDERGAQIISALFVINDPADKFVVGVTLVPTSSRDAITVGTYELVAGLNRPDVLDLAAPPDSSEVRREFHLKFQFDPSFTSQPNTALVEGVIPLEANGTYYQGTTFLSMIPLGGGDTLYGYLTIPGQPKVSPVIAIDTPDSLNISPDVPFSSPAFIGTNDQTIIFTLSQRAEELGLTLFAYYYPDEGETEIPDEVPYRLFLGVNEPTILEGEAYTGAFGELLTTNNPTLIDVGIELLQIVDVDQKSENFTVVAVLRAEWIDPSLIFHPADNDGSRLKRFVGDQVQEFFEENERVVWPRFVIDNQQDERDIQNQVIHVQSDGTITYEERFSATLQAPDFDFVAFPFDDQFFRIELTTVFPVEEFILQERREFRRVGTQLGEEEFRVVSDRGEVVLVDGISEYHFIMDVTRTRTFYIYRIFIPLALIIGMGWMISLFIMDADTRLTASSGNLLLLIAFNFTIGDDLPRLGYLTFMDALLMASFIIATVVFLFDVYLYFQNQAIEEAEEAFHDTLRSLTLEERKQALAKPDKPHEQMEARWRRWARLVGVVYSLSYIAALIYLWTDFL
jgi:hypothetical protein